VVAGYSRAVEVEQMTGEKRNTHRNVLVHLKWEDQAVEAEVEVETRTVEDHRKVCPEILKEVGLER